MKIRTRSLFRSVRLLPRRNPIACRLLKEAFVRLPSTWKFSRSSIGLVWLVTMKRVIWTWLADVWIRIIRVSDVPGARATWPSCLMYTVREPRLKCMYWNRTNIMLPIPSWCVCSKKDIMGWNWRIRNGKHFTTGSISMLLIMDSLSTFPKWMNLTSTTVGSNWRTNTIRQGWIGGKNWPIMRKYWKVKGPSSLSCLLRWRKPKPGTWKFPVGLSIKMRQQKNSRPTERKPVKSK